MTVLENGIRDHIYSTVNGIAASRHTICFRPKYGWCLAGWGWFLCPEELKEIIGVLENRNIECGFNKPRTVFSGKNKS